MLPAFVPRERIVEIEWGADTERFSPGATGAAPVRERPGRAGRGVRRRIPGVARRHHLVRAMRELRARGRRDLDAVLIGDGPELAPAKAEADGIDGITFTGAVAHERMPACLAAADIGVAPFDVAAHPPLQLAFYWSPLKVFEYMAAGLPVVAPAIPRLARILGPGHERLLYDARAPGALAGALAYAGRPRGRAPAAWARRPASASAPSSAGRRTARSSTTPSAGMRRRSR